MGCWTCEPITDIEKFTSVWCNPRSVVSECSRFLGVAIWASGSLGLVRETTDWSFETLIVGLTSPPAAHDRNRTAIGDRCIYHSRKLYNEISPGPLRSVARASLTETIGVNSGEFLRDSFQAGARGRLLTDNPGAQRTHECGRSPYPRQESQGRRRRYGVSEHRGSR